MNIKLSIIIPSFNNLTLLKECIKSIEYQTFTNFEVWIIDGGSNDGTTEYLKTLQNPFHWISEKDTGVYEAMNKGINLSKGEWLYFFGCDDRITDNNTLNSIFCNSIDKEIALIIGSIQYAYCENDSLFLKKNDGVVSSSWSRKMWIKNTIHHQGIFYKKELFLNLKYSLKYQILSDYALNLSLFKKGVRTKTIHTIVAICGTNGMSKGYQWKMYKEEIDLKTTQSSILLKPIFFIISLVKYLVKQKI